MRFSAVLVVVFVVAAHLAGVPAPAGELAGPARVIDGDTLEIAGTRIRLHGIDAPESGQRCRDARGRGYACGAAATRALERLAADGPVRCAGEAHDDYGRLIAVCRSRAGRLNAAMVRSGWALAFRRYADDYVAAEADAERAGRGLWAGRFEKPWDFRRDRWRSASAAAPAPPQAECAIKGNISANGRIFHVPGSRYYDRTAIDRANGERWFCSEADAVAAGWRAPRN